LFLLLLLLTVVLLTYEIYLTNVNKNRTFRLFTSDPLSVVIVTSEVVVDSWVDGTVVVQYTVQSVRICTTLRWHGCRVVILMKNSRNI